MGFLSSRKQAAWVHGLLQWANGCAVNVSLTQSQRERAMGVAMWAAFVTGRGDNPYEMNLKPDVRIGVRDANRLVNNVVTSSVIPKRDYALALEAAHNELVADDIAKGDPLVHGLDNMLDSVVAGVLESLESNTDLSEEARAQMRANLEGIHTPVEGLSEDLYCRLWEEWAAQRLAASVPESYDAENLLGVLRALAVREKKLDALAMSTQADPSGPWEGYSEAFLDGYVVSLRLFGNQRYFSRVAFTPEIAEQDLAFSQKASQFRKEQRDSK